MTVRWLPFDDKPDLSPSELCWGRGLVPRGLEHAPPDCGGMYAGR
jgi:hypothetical protein